MKKVPLKILAITLLTGIICIISILLISNRLIKLESMHKRIMTEAVADREQMAKISVYLDRSHAIVNCIMMTSDEEKKQKYIKEEQEINEYERSLILGFHDRCMGGEREKLYHTVYSNYCAYLNNIKTILVFSGDEKIELTSYYNDNTLMNFLDKIHLNIDKLDQMTVEEIEQSQKEMQKYIRLSSALRTVCIIIVLAMLIFCAIYCFKLTQGLDSIKEDLEAELVLKNKSIQEHNENLIRLQDGVIISIANLIEDRDLETGEHVKRTSFYVELLARKAKADGVYGDILTEEYIERLAKAAPLHDIGKISVSDSILLKPGKLTSEEFEKMKSHASEGGKIIRQVFGELEDEEYVVMAADVARSHHEKWDGSGYGLGLVGDDIPLCARIMAIADVFDALVSKRCYKEAFPLDKAFEIIAESTGSHFDPKLAEVFLKLRPEIEAYLST